MDKGAFRVSREYPNGAGVNAPVMLPGKSAEQPPGSAVSAMPSFFGGSSSNKNAITEPQKYGSITCQPVAISAGASTTILFQPDTTRVFLLIQNLDATADIWVQFGTAAAINNGIRISAGGSLLLDAFVAQDDVQVFCASAVTISLSYANKPNPV